MRQEASPRGFAYALFQICMDNGYISDKWVFFPYEGYEQALLDLLQAIHGKDSREYYVLMNYFGLCNTEPLSLSAIGDNYNFSRQNAHKIKEKALREIVSVRILWRTLEDKSATTLIKLWVCKRKGDK